jgi:hypothetical protein
MYGTPVMSAHLPASLVVDPLRCVTTATDATVPRCPHRAMSDTALQQGDPHHVNTDRLQLLTVSNHLLEKTEGW